MAEIVVDLVQNSLLQVDNIQQDSDEGQAVGSGLAGLNLQKNFKPSRPNTFPEENALGETMEIRADLRLLPIYSK